MLTLVAEHDTMVIGMASEKFVEGGGAQCLSARMCTARRRRWCTCCARKRACERSDHHRSGLAPVGADTYGLVNMGLDAMRLIRANAELAGVHLSVGLTNFSFGMPRTFVRRWRAHT
jgi:5-methyltetrahydrofolate--homocysteine methyltransferase